MQHTIRATAVQDALYFIAPPVEYGRGSPSSTVLVAIMRNETPSSELIRLLKEQRKTQQDEVFGGLSPAERAAYDIRQDRIHDLERDVPEPNHRSLRNAA